MKKIKVGDRIENFELKDQNDSVFNLTEFKGGKILLSWHPLAWTGICAQQMKALEERFSLFSERGITPFGVSIDHAPCKKAWADSIGLKKLRLLCDFWPHGDLAKKLGIFHDGFGFSGRVNILLSGDGEVLHIKQYQIKELPDFDEFLKEIGG